MPKHKKFLKSEKAKIKLNLKGAKLPKGLNVTKTDFKVKKIVIKEQITDTFNSDGTIIRKQNIKELLSKLQHHNATYRNEGIRYLKEMLANYPEETNNHFGPIVHGIAQLSLDIEKDVRKESAKALGILLAMSNENCIAPFFGTLSSYLRCAMTHIQLSIQEDSLFMLDNLINNVPRLVAANSDRIFQSFLDMISKLRIESKPERTLSVNLGSTITSVKWRSKVLDRLLGMLKAMVEAKKTDVVAPVVSSEVGDVLQDGFSTNPGFKPKTGRTNAFLVDKPMYFSLIRKHHNQTCELPVLFKKTIGTMTTTTGQIGSVGFNDEGRRIQHYVEQLMPLMFETWIEVRPSNFGQEFNEDLVLSNEASFSLKTILEIIDSLYQLITFWDKEVNNQDLSNWFRSTYNREFCAQIFVAFPYAQSEGFKGSKKKAKGIPTDDEVQASGGSKCSAQNLSIAYLFSCLNEDLDGSNRVDAERVVSYLIKNVSTLNNANPDTTVALVKLLRAVLLTNGTKWDSPNVSTKALLSATIESYQDSKFAKDIRTKVLVLLCDIVLDVNLCRRYGNELFTSWLVTLPQMLCQPFVSQHVLTTFTCLAKQQNELFLTHLEQHVPGIIENLPIIQITGVDDQFEGRKLIMDLFYWIKNTEWVNASKVDQLTDENVKRYVNQIVHLKSIYVI